MKSLIENGSKANILGTEYTVVVKPQKDEPKMEKNDGYCEFFSKEIVIFGLDEYETDKSVLKNIEEYQLKVLKHEIVHAFLHESGLDSNSEWARNEELVDWIALQFDKIGIAIESCKTNALL